jgi:hypothetical protein
LIITEPPKPFSFPTTTGEGVEERLNELRDLEITLKKEEQKRRLEELQTLVSILQDEPGMNDPTQLRNIKSLLKDEGRKKLLEEVENRRSILRNDTSLDDEPKLFRSPFSLLLCQLDGVADPLTLLENIRGLRQRLTGQQFGKLSVEDVSPNWLMSVSSQGGATGGPGALPMPFIEGDNLTYQFDQIKQELIDAGLYDEGANVDVAILDTCPTDHALVLATKTSADHPLLRTLLGSSGQLIPYHATPTALFRMASTSVNQHDYPMTNHGLFAAGIVHNIVPKARIHLIEVLNEFGVGDLASLAEGLSLAYHQIYKPQSGRRLVVNCSWMLELPLSDLHCNAPEEDVEHDFEMAIRRYVEEDREHALNLRTICNKLAKVGGVVASAGNDKKHAKKRRRKKLQKLKKYGVTGENRGRWIEYLLEYLRKGTPEARYPAAFASVVGVGALPQGSRRTLPANKYVSSNYSNLGDKPAGDAIMTLGGEEGRGPAPKHKNKGLLGLYLGDQFPEVEEEEMRGAPHRRKIKMVAYPNDHCWAWWAGTSFAAPVLTGVIAAVFGTGRRTTKEALEVLKARPHMIIEKDGTDALEDTMYVKQGP